MIWFKGFDVYDSYRNVWKSCIEPKKGWNHKYKKGSGVRNNNKKEVIATMFIPPSKGSLLFNLVKEEEEKIADDMDWNIKLMEQSGIPLCLTFIPKFPLEDGCPRGKECAICSDTNILCKKKGVIYKATCLWCKNAAEPDNICNNPKKRLLLQELGSASHESKDLVMGEKVPTTEQDGSEHTVCGMDGMNKELIGGRGDRDVGMNGMNNKHYVGGIVGRVLPVMVT